MPHLFFSYLKIQIKRLTFRSLGVMAFSAIFFAVLTFVASIFTKNMNFSGNKAKISVGIVGDSSIPYFEAGLSALKNLDSSKLYINLLNVTEEEAKKLLRKNKISAYVIIPQGFVEAVEVGQNDVKVTFVTAAGSQGIESILKEEVSNIVSTLLANAQAGIFAMENIAYQKIPYETLSSYVYDLNFKYIDWTLSRQNLASIVEKPLSASLSIQGYYLCALLISFLLFFALCAVHLFCGEKNDCYKFFASKGIKSFSQVFCEWFSYFLLMMCSTLIIFLFLTFIFKFKFLTLAEWQYTGFLKGLLILFLHTVPLCILFSSLHFMIFEILPNTVSCTLCIFLTSFFLCFFGGCFYPLDFFSSFLQKLGKVLPSGKALLFLSHGILSDSFSQKDFFTTFAFLILYSAIFIFISVVARKRKTGKSHE